MFTLIPPLLVRPENPFAQYASENLLRPRKCHPVRGPALYNSGQTLFHSRNGRAAAVKDSAGVLTTSAWLVRAKQLLSDGVETLFYAVLSTYGLIVWH